MNRKPALFPISILCFVVGLLFFLTPANDVKAANYTFYAKRDTGNISDIQYYLDKAANNKNNKYTITVQPGTYKMTGSGLHIYSNTTLNMKNVKIVRKTSQIGAMLQVGYPRSEKNGGYSLGGYKRGKNITINGGYLYAGKNVKNVKAVTSLFTFSHVQNMKINGMSFYYKPKKVDNAHMIEFGAAKNLKIYNCKFYGNTKVGEAVQIESAIKNVAGSELMGKTDGTKTSNVKMYKCLVSNFAYGVGTNHGCSKDVYKKMEFNRCTFKGITKYAICTYNYKKVKIKKCKYKFKRGGQKRLKLGKY